MLATRIHAPNVVINEPSRAEDHLPCTNLLSSDSAMPVLAQPNTTLTFALPVHDATFTLPTTLSPEISTPNSPTPCSPPGPASSPSPPPPRPSPVQLQTEIACPDCCSLPSSFSFPLDASTSTALESPQSHAIHQSSTEASNLPVLNTSSTPNYNSLLHDELLQTPTHSDSMALLDTTMVLPFTTPS